MARALCPCSSESTVLLGDRLMHIMRLSLILIVHFDIKGRERASISMITSCAANNSKGSNLKNGNAVDAN